MIDRLALVGGAGLIIGGVAMVYVPAAVILSGVLLMAGALWRKA